MGFKKFIISLLPFFGAILCLIGLFIPFLLYRFDGVLSTFIIFDIQAFFDLVNGKGTIQTNIFIIIALIIAIMLLITSIKLIISSIKTAFSNKYFNTYEMKFIWNKKGWDAIRDAIIFLLIMIITVIILSIMYKIESNVSIFFTKFFYYFLIQWGFVILIIGGILTLIGGKLIGKLRITTV